MPITSSSTPEALAIIPARGGSKGLPRKNVLPLAGKPLIAHMIEQARQAATISRVVVSTDDGEIAEIAERFTAEVVWRPREISGDYAASEQALLHVLHHLQSNEGYNPELLVFLQCTSPLTLAEDIDGTVLALLDAGADTALAVAAFHYFLWQPTADGAVGLNHDKQVRLLRQQREPQYLETGAVYAMRTAGFLEAQHRFFGHTALYEMPGERVLEIDEPVDFQQAAVVLRARQQHLRQAELPAVIDAVIFDFDGVFTDNRVFVQQDGREAVLCNRSDGWGLERLRETGVRILVLSTEKNPVVQARCEKLHLEYQQGIVDKASALRAWLLSTGIAAHNAVFVGNDDNDLTCLEMVGCGIAVADAYPRAKERARILLEHAGGAGAVREVTDMILQQTRKATYATHR